MATASEIHKLMTEYYEAWGVGDAKGIEGIQGYYASNVYSYIAGESELSRECKSSQDTEKLLTRLVELNGGQVQLVGRPQIILAGDTFAAVIVKERHKRAGKPEMIAPRLCVYEIKDGKIGKIFLWQTESKTYDEYYPR